MDDLQFRTISSRPSSNVRTAPPPIRRPFSKPEPEAEATTEQEVTTAPVVPDDQSWLESFAIRAKVNAERFDADARLWRAISTIEQSIFELVSRTLAERSGGRFDATESAILPRLALLNPPDKWLVCSVCGGTGNSTGKRCQKCGGSGYEITGTGLGEIITAFSNRRGINCPR